MLSQMGEAKGEVALVDDETPFVKKKFEKEAKPSVNLTRECAVRCAEASRTAAAQHQQQQREKTRAWHATTNQPTNQPTTRDPADAA